MMRSRARRAILAAVAVVAACARSVYTGEGSTPVRPTVSPWPVITRSHVDLWLHGYAVLLRDTSTVPVFRRGYRERVQAAKTQRNLVTRLDQNRTQLQARFAVSPQIINGQFLPLYFASWEQMQQVIDLFLTSGGDPRLQDDRAMAQLFAVLAQSFATTADREWLRVFVESLDDERRRFYQEYWTTEHATRIALVRTADSLWQATYRSRLQRFLNNSQQEAGDFVLALTLGGEGRTVNFAARQNAIASTMPDTEAVEALYVFAHECVAGIVSSAVNDNTTPADQRAGLAGRYITTGTVRAGAILLQRVAPELVAGYTRYYLMQAGQATTGDATARLASVFPLPDIVRQAIERQIDVTLGGI